MMLFFTDITNAHWLWLTLGVVLCAMELIIPGVYLMWIGGACLVTGLLVSSIPFALPVPLQLGIFAVLAVLSIYVGRRFFAGDRDETPEAAPTAVNQRGQQLIGKICRVSEAIRGGSGKVALGDTHWLARGQDCSVDATVKIIDVDGNTLIVEPA